MYELFYNVLIPKFGNNISLLYEDTDSFVLNIINGDDIDKVLEDPDLNTHFDFSDYPRDHPLYSDSNKKNNR